MQRLGSKCYPLPQWGRGIRPKGLRDDLQVLDRLRRPRRSSRHGADGHTRQRAPLLERAPGHGLLEDRGHRPLHGRARLQHPLAGRAPLPARGLRVPAQHPDARRASRASDLPAPHGLRLQHHAHVAPAPPGRGLCRRRHLDGRAHRLRRGSRLSHPRGGDLRRPHARRRGQSRSLRGAGRHHHEGLSLGVLRAQGQALHPASRRAVPRV